MSYTIILAFCVILSNTYQTQTTVSTTHSKQSVAENASANARAFGWSTFSNKISDLLVVKKNTIAAYPLQLASTLIDKLCM